MFYCMVSSKHHLYRITLIECVDIYIKNPENPDLETWINKARFVSQNFVGKGKKKGVRVTADLSSYFLSSELTKRWFDLEYALQKKLSLSMSVLCGYHRYLLAGE